MVFERTAFSILRGAKAHNGFQHLIAYSSRSRIYSATRDSTRLALRRPFASHSFHGVENNGKEESASDTNEGKVKKVQKNFLLPSHHHGGLNLTDLEAEIAKVLGSYELARECLYHSYDNQFNGLLATVTEDQVELIKKSLKVISVIKNGDVKLHTM